MALAEHKRHHYTVQSGYNTGNNDTANFDLIIKKMIQEYTFHQNFLQSRIL